MPIPSSGTLPISFKDVVSYTLDDPQYDVDRPVLIDPRDPSKHITHRTAKDLVQRLIAGLHSAGLQKDDTVCIHSFNSLIYPLLVLAIIGAGGRGVSTNPSYTRAELNHGVKVAKIRFVLAEPDILPNMLQALKENNIDVGSRLFVLDTEPDHTLPQGLKSWRRLLEHGTEDWIRFDDEKMAKESIAQLYYTSGTTGLPKCAMTSHHNLVAQHTLFWDANPRSWPVRLILTMPFFHVGIFPQVLTSALKDGRSAYVMRRFELEPYLRYHAQYELTETFMVPPMVVAIVMSGLADPESPNYSPKYSLQTVRHGTVGAAPISADMQARFAALLGKGATFVQVWGMTETTTMAAWVPFDLARKCAAGQLDAAWGSIGRPIANLSMKLVDESGNDITTDRGTSDQPARGELCVKGPTIVNGYFDNPAATAASWDADGYFHTGDVISIDPATGLMYVVERVKELIKVRGFQVAPAELEGALTEHSGIIDAAVIGVTDANGIEHPRAYIVRRRSGHKLLSETDVQAHMRDRVARYKQLTGGVVFVDAIPKSPSGKILKRILREEEELAKKEGREKAKL